MVNFKHAAANVNLFIDHYILYLEEVGKHFLAGNH